jgi:hypothetical protein
MIRCNHSLTGFEEDTRLIFSLLGNNIANFTVNTILYKTSLGAVNPYKFVSGISIMFRYNVTLT